MILPVAIALIKIARIVPVFTCKLRQKWIILTHVAGSYANLLRQRKFYIRKRFNSHKIGLGHQHGRLLIVLGHLHDMAEVMFTWKGYLHVSRLIVDAPNRILRGSGNEREGRGWVRCVANPIFQRRCFPSATFYNHKFYKTASANHISSFL